jgi:signal transduction histidine kinase
MDWGAFVEEGVLDTFFEWTVPLVSLMLLGLLVGVVRLRVADPGFLALALVLPLLFVTLILWQGLQLDGTGLSEGGRRTVAWWYALGIYTMLGLGAWTLLLDLFGQRSVPAGVEILTLVIAGGFFGLLVGTAQVRAERNAEKATQAELEGEYLARQQETNVVLNRILRHHLLNSLTVIRGQGQLLDEKMNGEGDGHVERIVRQADEMTETIEEIREITRTLTEDPDLLALDLGPVLTAELDRLRERYPDASVSVVGADPSGLTVTANDLLGRALANVLHNAVEHNPGPEPTVEVVVTETDGSVLVAVADDGPGVAPDIREEMFAASERGIDSDGEGLGLFLTASVLRQYGGAVWLADDGSGSESEPDDGIDTAAADAALERTTLDGAVVVLSLPKASADAAPSRGVAHSRKSG